MSWFKINGVHSSDLNIKVLEVHKPILPQINDHRENIAGRDGSILFPLSFGDKEITVDCMILHESKETRTQDLRTLSSKLYTYDEVKIEFDDEPDVYYLGKISENIDLDRYPTFGLFSIKFICNPFSTSLESTEISNKYTAVEEKTVEAICDGTAPSEFTLEVTPEVGVQNFTVKIGDDELKYIGIINTNQKFVLNTEDLEAYIIDGSSKTNVSEQLRGRFPLILPGNNTITFSGNPDFAVNIKINFSNRYL